MSETTERFDTWAVVEIFGHQRFAGRVTEQAIGGCSFVRLDVPALDAEKGRPAIGAYTKLFGQGAIYSISPCSEEFALAVVRTLRASPVALYVPEFHGAGQHSLPEPAGPEDDDETDMLDPWEDE